MPQPLRPSERKTIELCAMLAKMGVPYRAYSGRFMYGAQCVAVEENLRVLASQSAEAEIDHRAFAKLMAQSKQDDLGMGTITYWPYFPYKGPEHLAVLHIRALMEEMGENAVAVPQIDASPELLRDLIDNNTISIVFEDGVGFVTLIEPEDIVSAKDA